MFVRGTQFDERFEAEITVLERLVVVLFHQDCADKSDYRGLVGEYSDHVSAALDLACSAFRA